MQIAQQARRHPETTHDIKLKTNSRQAGKLTLLTFSNFSFPSSFSLSFTIQRQATSMFHMQLVVSRRKKKKIQKQKSCQQQQLATG